MIPLSVEKILRTTKILIRTIYHTVFLIPVLLVLLLPNLLLRSASKIAARIFCTDLHRIYNSRLRYALESVHDRPKSTILVLLVCDGPVCLENLRKIFKDRILNYQDDKETRPYIQLKQYWTQFLGYFYWKWDRNFRLENHVRSYDYGGECWLPAMCSEDDLRQVAGSLVTQPFVEGRSPWELLVIPNYILENNGDGGETKLGTVLALRIHHGLADGYSILGMLVRLSQSKVNTSAAKFNQMGLLSRFLRTVQILLKLPWDLATFLNSLNEAPNDWNLVGVKMSRKYETFFSKSISVGTIKKIARSFGVSYNAVVYSITAGAAARMMKAAGHQVPRRFTTIFPKPLPGHPGGLSNHAQLGFFDYFPHEPNARERLKQTGKAVQPARVFQTSTFGCAWISQLYNYLPAPIHRLNEFQFKATLGASSFPGPAECVPIDENANVVEFFAMSGAGHGTSVGGVSIMTSIGGKQRITLALDQVVLQGRKKPLDFSRFVDEELQELLSKHDLSVRIKMYNREL